MKLLITFSSYSRELQRLMKQHFVYDEAVKITDTKRVGDDGMRTFKMEFNFHERTELKKYISDYGPKSYALIGLEEVLGTNLIIINKETNSGACGDYLISIDQNDLEYRAFHDLSKKELIESVKIWESWNDLLMRLPLSWQREVFINSVANMAYFEIKEVLNGEKTFDAQFTEHGEFMQHMIDNKHINYEAVKSYMQSRFDCGIYLNKI